MTEESLSRLDRLLKAHMVSTLNDTLDLVHPDAENEVFFNITTVLTHIPPRVILWTMIQGLAEDNQT